MEALLGGLAALGLPGLFIIFLILQNRSLSDRLDKANERIEALQEKRIAENREIVEVVRGNAVALHTNNELIRREIDSARGRP